MRKSLSFHSSVRNFKYIVLVLLFYPLTVLGAQGHITVKGQSITIKEAIMLIEKNSNYKKKQNQKAKQITKKTKKNEKPIRTNTKSKIKNNYD